MGEAVARLDRSTEKEKLFRDPVHGYIIVPKEFRPLVGAREFQRLRRIRQLGLSFVTYHGADHSRFGHSLGVFHLFRRLVAELERKRFSFSEDEKLVGSCAALFHDLGHGPFSHALEGIMTPGKKHEAWALEIIGEASELRTALEQIDLSLPDKTLQVLRGDPRWQLIRNIISSQLDIDRMDYLLRDALMTGTTYGSFDLARLLAVLELNEGRSSLVVHNKGLMAAEQFVFARYYAYWQIYYHKTTRGAEKLLQAVWRRAGQLSLQEKGFEDWVPPSVRPFLRGQYDWRDFLAVDDFDIWAALKGWQTCSHPLLADLSGRLLHRILFKPIRIEDPTKLLGVMEQVKEIVREKGYDPEYYLLVDRQSDVAYDYYTAPEEGDKPPIEVVDHFGIPRDISKLSDPIRAIAGQRKVVTYLYVPDEVCRSEVERILR